MRILVKTDNGNVLFEAEMISYESEMDEVVDGDIKTVNGLRMSVQSGPVLYIPNVSETTANECIQKLLEKGFIDLTSLGEANVSVIDLFNDMIDDDEEFDDDDLDDDDDEDWSDGEDEEE